MSGDRFECRYLSSHQMCAPSIQNIPQSHQNMAIHPRHLSIAIDLNKCSKTIFVSFGFMLDLMADPHHFGKFLSPEVINFFIWGKERLVFKLSIIWVCVCSRLARDHLSSDFFKHLRVQMDSPKTSPTASDWLELV